MTTIEEAGNLPKYRAYDRANDRIATADELLSERGPEATAVLDRRLASSMARLAPSSSTWVARTTSSAMDEAEVRGEDVLVTLLVSVSGSARGEILSAMAPAVLTVAKALEENGCAVEILGHTTRTWNGGRTQDKWHADGRPKNPGRVCDLLHVVFKSVDQTCDEAAPGLALMMDERFAKENVDGEAIEWACERAVMIGRPGSVVVHVVDKTSPIDMKTIENNGAGFLEAHRDVVLARVNGTPGFVVTAAGLGSSASRGGADVDLSAQLGLVHPGAPSTLVVDPEEFSRVLSHAVLAALSLRPDLEASAAPGI